MDARRIYYLIIAMRNIGFSTAFTLYAIYLVRNVGANPLQLVLPGTAYEVATFLFEIPTGVVADVYSRRLSIIIGFVLLGVGIMLSASIVIFEIVFIGLIIAGIGSTFVSGALSAWIVDEIGQEEVSKAFVRRAQIRLVAGFVGIALSIILGSINLQLAVIGGGATLIVLALILIVIMPETGFQRVPVEERESWKDLFKAFRQGVKVVRAHHILLWIMLVTFIISGFDEAFGKLWQAHILDVFTLPTLGNFDDIVWFGIISGIFTPVTLVAIELVRRRVDLSDNDAIVRTLTWVFGIMIVCVLIFALSEIFLLALLGLWIIQMLMAIVRPLMEAWINQHTESSVRATILSMQGQIGSFGEIGGGPIVGFIGTITSIRIALSFTTLILLPLLPVFRRTSKLES
jgi:MFS transporter, DHA3 family, tetracycline resistance protein